MSNFPLIYRKFLTGSESLDKANAEELIAIRKHFDELVHIGQSPVDLFDGIVKGTAAYLSMVFAGYRKQDARNSDYQPLLASARNDGTISDQNGSQVHEESVAKEGGQQQPETIPTKLDDKSSDQVQNANQPCVLCQSTEHKVEEHYVAAFSDHQTVNQERLSKAHICGYCQQQYHSCQQCRFLKECICSNCYQKGHYTWVCRDKTVARRPCFGCKKFGHQLIDCTLVYGRVARQVHARVAGMLKRNQDYDKGSLYDKTQSQAFAFWKPPISQSNLPQASNESNVATEPDPWDSVSQQHMDIRYPPEPELKNDTDQNVDSRWGVNTDISNAKVEDLLALKPKPKALVPMSILVNEAIKQSSEGSPASLLQNIQNSSQAQQDIVPFEELATVQQSTLPSIATSREVSAPPGLKIEKTVAPINQRYSVTVLLSCDQLVSVLQDDRRAFLTLPKKYMVSVTCMSFVNYESQEGTLLWNVTVSGNKEQVLSAQQALKDMYDDDDPWNESENEDDNPISANQSEGWLLKEDVRQNTWNTDSQIGVTANQGQQNAHQFQQNCHSGHRAQGSSYYEDQQYSKSLVPQSQRYPQVSQDIQASNNINRRSEFEYCAQWNVSGYCNHGSSCNHLHRCLLCFDSSHPKRECPVKHDDIRPCVFFQCDGRRPQFGCSRKSAQCRKAHVCAYCLQPGHNLKLCHNAKDCPLTHDQMFQILMSQGFINKQQLYTNVHPTSNLTISRIGFCASWNISGICRFQRCQYVHRCSKCNSPGHPRMSCQVPRALVHPCPDYNKVSIDPMTDQQGACKNSTQMCRFVHSCAYCFRNDHSLVMCDRANNPGLIKDLLQYGTVFESGRYLEPHDVENPDNKLKQFCRLFNNGNCPFSNGRCHRVHLCEYPFIKCRIVQSETSPVKLTEKALQSLGSSERNVLTEWKLVPCQGQHHALSHGLSFCASWNNNGMCSVAQSHPEQLVKDKDGFINMSNYFAPCKQLHVCAICKSPAHPATKCDSSIVTSNFSLQQSSLSVAKVMSGQQVQSPSQQVTKLSLCYGYNSSKGCFWSDWHCPRVHVCSQCLQVGHKCGNGCGSSQVYASSYIGNGGQVDQQTESEIQTSDFQERRGQSSEVSFHSTFSSQQDQDSLSEYEQERIYELPEVQEEK